MRSKQHIIPCASHKGLRVLTGIYYVFLRLLSASEASVKCIQVSWKPLHVIDPIYPSCALPQSRCTTRGIQQLRHHFRIKAGFKQGSSVWCIQVYKQRVLVQPCSTRWSAQSSFCCLCKLVHWLPSNVSFPHKHGREINTHNSKNVDCQINEIKVKWRSSIEAPQTLSGHTCKTTLTLGPSPACHRQWLALLCAPAQALNPLAQQTTMPALPGNWQNNIC